MKRTAEVIVHYSALLNEDRRARMVSRTPKMVLGVGPQVALVDGVPRGAAVAGTDRQLQLGMGQRVPGVTGPATWW